MPSSPFTPQLRPLSIGEILDAGFRLLRSRFGALMACVLVPIVPLAILNTVIIASTNPETFDVNATATSDSASEVVGVLGARLLLGLGGLLAVAACFKVISAAYLGERSSAGESLRYGLSRLPALVGASIVLLIALVPAFIALAIPGIFLAVKWCVASTAIVAERAGPLKGLSRSWALTRGHWWRTFATLLVLGLIGIVLWFAILFTIGAALASVDSISTVTVAVLDTLIIVLILALLYPLDAAVLTVLYYDMRVRNEGYDLQLLARGVGADTSPFEAAPERPVPPSATPAPTPSPSSSGGFAPPEGPAAAS